MKKYLYYKVCWGDTIDSIAIKYKLSPEYIKYINDIENIFVGQILLIPIFNFKNYKVIKELNTSLSYCLKRHKSKQNLFYYNIF